MTVPPPSFRVIKYMRLIRPPFFPPRSILRSPFANFYTPQPILNPPPFPDCLCRRIEPHAFPLFSLLQKSKSITFPSCAFHPIFFTQRLFLLSSFPLFLPPICPIEYIRVNSSPPPSPRELAPPFHFFPLLVRALPGLVFCRSLSFPTEAFFFFFFSSSCVPLLTCSESQARRGLSFFDGGAKVLRGLFFSGTAAFFLNSMGHMGGRNFFFFFG